MSERRQCSSKSYYTLRRNIYSEHDQITSTIDKKWNYKTYKYIRHDGKDLSAILKSIFAWFIVIDRIIIFIYVLLSIAVKS